ncbi:MAG: Na/Pi symporter, partial [archaeon]
TGIIQSSAATTIITIGLVSAGTITFAQSIGIIFGANIGTTLTSQLVAFHFTELAPIIILLGFVLSLLKTKYKIFGKPLFYLGLLLFALNLISLAIVPLKTDPQIAFLLTQTSIIPIGILIGFIVTNLFQSSSVTTGLVVIMAQNGLIGLPEAIPIIFGANIGTTVLSLVVSSRMDTFARRAAVSHFLFNFFGVLLFIPLIPILILTIEFIGGSTGQQIANAHLVFNVISTIVLLIFIKYFQKLIEKLIPTKEKEIILRTEKLEGIENQKPKQIFEAIDEEFKNSLNATIEIFNESNVILLSNKGDLIKVTKLCALSSFIHKESKRVLTNLAKQKLSKEESETLVRQARLSKLFEQISILGKNVCETIINAKDNSVIFSEKGISALDKCISEIGQNLILIKDNYPTFDSKTSALMRKNGNDLRLTITQNYDEYLARLIKGQSTSGSTFAEVLGLIEETEGKAREIRKVCQLKK